MPRRICLLTLAFILVILTVAASRSPITAQEPLSQTYRDAFLQFRFPANWGATTFSGLVAISNDAAFHHNVSELSPGTAAVLFFPPPATTQIIRDAPSAADPIAKATQVVAHLRLQTTSAIALLPTSQYPVAAVAFRSRATEGLLLLLTAPAGDVTIFAAAPPGAFALYESTVLAIVATVTVHPVRRLAQGSVIWQVQQPRGDGLLDTFAELGDVALGPDDTLYIADGRAVQIITADGILQPPLLPITTHGTPIHVGDVAIGTDGVLWLADALTGTIYWQAASGQFVPVERPAFATATSRMAIEIDAGPTGTLYVATLRWLDTSTPLAMEVVLEVIAPDGTVRSRAVLSPEASAPYRYGGTMNAGPDGAFYLSTYGGELALYTPLGVMTGHHRFERLGAVLEVGPDGSVLLASLVITFYTSRYAYAWQYGEPAPAAAATQPLAAGQFYAPQGVAVLSTGDLIVVDRSPAYAQVVRVTFWDASAAPPVDETLPR